MAGVQILLKDFLTGLTDKPVVESEINGSRKMPLASLTQKCKACSLKVQLPIFLSSSSIYCGPQWLLSESSLESQVPIHAGPYSYDRIKKCRCIIYPFILSYQACRRETSAYTLLSVFWNFSTSAFPSHSSPP